VTTLTLAGCDLLTGTGLGRLSRLQNLRLNSCPQVTEASIQASTSWRAWSLRRSMLPLQGLLRLRFRASTYLTVV